MNELPPNLSVTPNNYPWNGAYVNSLAPNTKHGDALIVLTALPATAFTRRKHGVDRIDESIQRKYNYEYNW